MPDGGASPRFSSSSKFGSTGPPTISAPVASAARTISSSQSGEAISSSSIIRKLVAVGNVASAVSNAALIAWQLPCRGSTTQSPGNCPTPENSIATGTLSLLRRVVLDHDHGEAAIGALIGQQLQRLPQMLRPAKAGNADDDLDRGGIERGRHRRQCASGRAAWCQRFPSADNPDRILAHVQFLKRRPEPGSRPPGIRT